MKVVLCVIVLSVGMVGTDMVGECFMAGFYSELGCTPEPSDDKSPCPAAFCCPDLHPDPSKCFYRSVAYGNGARIPESQILNPCSTFCNCVISGAPKIICAAVDCVENDMNSDERQQCVNTFELDSCCSTGSVCGTDAIAELKTCEVDGKSYYEGQQFEIPNTGKLCVCTADWDGKLNNGSCRDINCGVEIHDQDKIMQNCAPVFYGKSICPSGFLCPSATSKIIRGLNIRNNEAECSFGNYTMRVGDEVSVDDKCMECSCKVPPFASCSMKKDCNN